MEFFSTIRKKLKTKLDKFNEKYKIEENTLGQGGYGVVHRAFELVHFFLTIAGKKIL